MIDALPGIEDGYLTVGRMGVLVGCIGLLTVVLRWHFCIIWRLRLIFFLWRFWAFGNSTSDVGARRCIHDF